MLFDMEKSKTNLIIKIALVIFMTIGQPFLVVGRFYMEPYKTAISRIGKYHYINIHKWITYHYGKANRCEFCNSSDSNRRFHYALIKGKEYERNRDNYIMLCPSCHKKYDDNEDVNRRISEKLKGNKNCLGKTVPQERRDRIRKTLSIPIIQKTKTGTFVKYWDSSKQACTTLGIGNITDVLKGKRKTSAGYKWEYA